jgi:hypothetical protein
MVVEERSGDADGVRERDGARKDKQAEREEM